MGRDVTGLGKGKGKENCHLPVHIFFKKGLTVELRGYARKSELVAQF